MIIRVLWIISEFRLSALTQSFLQVFYGYALVLKVKRMLV